MFAAKTMFAAQRGHFSGQCWIYFVLFPTITAACDLITRTFPLTAGETLVSAGQQFELGFFSAKASKWYVGVWYRNIEMKTVVWVANRDSPLRNPGGVLRIRASDGNLVLEDAATGNSVWCSNYSGDARDVVVQLLDSGNLVLRRENDGDPGNYLWESFNFPTDTLLPGMKLGWDSRSGVNRFITSWKSADDPSCGDYSFRIGVHGFPEAYLMNKNEIEHRSGAWNGVRFSGLPYLTKNPVLSFSFVTTPDEVSYSYNLTSESVYSRLVLNYSGAIQRLTWISARKIWSFFWYAPRDQCDMYDECGPNGICDASLSPVCKCLKGFVPKSPPSWNLRDFSNGCVRARRLDCTTDGFILMKFVKLPMSAMATINKDIGLAQCRDSCLKNCSCSGYSSLNIAGGEAGSGCAIWTGDLYDIRKFAVDEGGQDFYFRVSAADFAQVNHKLDPRVAVHIVVAIGVVSLIGLVLVVARMMKKKGRKPRTSDGNVRTPTDMKARSREFLLHSATTRWLAEKPGDSIEDELDFPVFELSAVVAATDQFSKANKLGQGGFGAVYKGKLADGQEIAVKRLSKTSVQGDEEFKNEVKMIARLQHRNLVGLVGCCVESGEKMLVYEYMENKSLDAFLFKKDASLILDWPTRFNIICGIARGLLYLHRDSRFRIVHRDLKASNVLLDGGMNPKISDFGMARIFGGDETAAETKRVVGTFGYMAPEYAMDGIFSVKSDVFSFGVLVLEIVSGKKNRGFYQTGEQENLLAYAWKLHVEEREMELMDPRTGAKSYAEDEVERCVKVGLLCVQEDAEERPNMSSVMLMLGSDRAMIPPSKQPGFCFRSESLARGTQSVETCTTNQITVTELQGR